MPSRTRIGKMGANPPPLLPPDEPPDEDPPPLDPPEDEPPLLLPPDEEPPPLDPPEEEPPPLLPPERPPEEPPVPLLPPEDPPDDPELPPPPPLELLEELLPPPKMPPKKLPMARAVLVTAFDTVRAIRVVTDSVRLTRGVGVDGSETRCRVGDAGRTVCLEFTRRAFLLAPTLPWLMEVLCGVLPPPVDDVAFLAHPVATFFAMLIVRETMRYSITPGIKLVASSTTSPPKSFAA